LHIGIPEGEAAAVDSLLAIIGDEGEDISALLEEQTSTSEPVKKKKEEKLLKKRRY
jgi:pyruvate dehydrogenase E2 component (dihydrolipoamide acetyltransferase)